jgi:hypothetical protein
MLMWWEVSSNSSRRSSWARAHHAWDLVIGISAARVASGRPSPACEPRASPARRAGCSGCYSFAPAAPKRHRGCPRPPNPRRQRAGAPSAETDRSPGQCSRVPKLPPRLQRTRSAACTHANPTLPPGGDGVPAAPARSTIRGRRTTRPSSASASFYRLRQRRTVPGSGAPASRRGIPEGRAAPFRRPAQSQRLPGVGAGAVPTFRVPPGSEVDGSVASGGTRGPVPGSRFWRRMLPPTSDSLTRRHPEPFEGMLGIARAVPAYLRRRTAPGRLPYSPPHGWSGPDNPGAGVR